MYNFTEITEYDAQIFLYVGSSDDYNMVRILRRYPNNNNDDADDKY